MSWKGIRAEWTGRPGTWTLLNKKRFFPVSELQKENDNQNKLFLSIIEKLTELENKIKNKSKLVNGAASPTSNSSNTSASSNQINQTAVQSKAVTSKGSNIKAYQEFINFKAIKEHQVVTGPLSSHLYSRGGTSDYSELTFKLLKCEARLIRSTFESIGFTYTESHDWNVLWIAAATKPYLYDGLNEYQKINHFPWSYEITRKDKYWLNILRMQEKFGKRNYYISPDTYLLPDEFADFFAEFHQVKSSEGRKPLWIVKPNASSQGKGIYLIDDVNDIDLDESWIISKYIPNPLLINGHKFDLRIYVLVTSFDPLRVYVYKEGLTRFATEEYTTSTTKRSRYIHLTNYSLNKKNPNWRTNEDIERDDFGFKWSITALCKHLEQIGIDMNLLWSKVYDLIIKALIAGEHPILNGMKRNLSYRTNWFELLGFDVLIDSDLKPWLLEINLSPALSADSPLDFTIKTNLIADTLNLAGIVKFDRRKESINKMKNRMKGSYSGKIGFTTKTGPTALKGLFTDETEEIIKLGVLSKDLEKLILDLENETKEYKELMIKVAKLKHRDLIKEIVYEYERRGNFVRIYPAPGWNEYDKFLQYQKTINRYLYKVLFGGDLVAKLEADMKSLYKLNYEVPKLSSYQQMREEQKGKAKPLGSSDASTADGSNKLPQINKGSADNSKVVITGDDVLIEYVTRLISKLGSINEGNIGEKEEDWIENFITHYVWHNEDKVESHLWDRLQNRLNEMILRRKKLLKSICK